MRPVSLADPTVPVRDDRDRHLLAMLAGDRSTLQLPGEDVVNVLDKVCAEIGYPTTIRVDQAASSCPAILTCGPTPRGVTIDFSRPGKPTDNAFIEAFNSRFRVECLNQHWFMSS
jgi:putative transposase